jgi:hypothetical protein
VVCEGYSDACFISALLDHKGVEEYQVGCPTSDSVGGEGKDKIPKYLEALATNKTGLRGILVLVDADDKPKTVFDAMAKALENATFPAPTKPFSIEGTNLFRVAVFMIPRDGSTGTLEDILWEAAVQKDNEVKICVEEFASCTGQMSKWKPNKQAKMRMHSTIAAYCEENPSCSLAWIWSQKGNPVPIDSTRFDHISKFLAEFIA